MTGFLGEDLAGVIGTWLAAAVTLAVWAHLAGERRVFGWGQHLLAGLLTGYLLLIAVREVLVPRLITPLMAQPDVRLDLWIGGVLVLMLAVGRWLPRPLAAPPVALLIAGVAAFALGGAVVGTLLPQLAAAMLRPGDDPGVMLTAAFGMGVTALVVLGFLHGVPRSGLVGVASRAGHWILVVGLGAWLGFLILSGLVLLVDRLDFLVFDWLGVGS
jgi:hypothetical protein